MHVGWVPVEGFAIQLIIAPIGKKKCVALFLFKNLMIIVIISNIDIS